jgi:hypothetical protein
MMLMRTTVRALSGGGAAFKQHLPLKTGILVHGYHLDASGWVSGCYACPKKSLCWLVSAQNHHFAHKLAHRKHFTNVHIPLV